MALSDGGTIEELQFLTNGIYVLTIAAGGVRHGMSSSWVTQVSGDPPLVAASVDVGHFSHGMIERAGAFGLNVVGRTAKRLEDYFYSAACKRENNLEPFALDETPRGVPLLREAAAGFECVVEAAHRAGDHTIFVARVESVRSGVPEPPLTSHDLDYVYLGTGRIVRRRSVG
jgi:flavin reductase (DIM6/NTAB) family NADH-FMN oxidoreductase RutF